ncbi:hypothetical protein Patl1_37510 [Pistacia atlantica]|nr:hypothetical protein Patl1_37510 [Pistacia atlantica]
MALSAPGVNTGGHDATTLRTSGPGSSSTPGFDPKKSEDWNILSSSLAYDCIRNSGLELNGFKAFEVPVKGLPNENNKEKLKDANGDSKHVDSSSESEDEDNGPWKEGCIAIFKCLSL